MKLRFVHLFLAAACAGSFAFAPAQSSEQTERVAASFVLALGRVPTAAELGQWGQSGQLAVADLIARHREQLQHDAAARRTMVLRAGHDALGRGPTDEEITSWSAAAPAAATYTELMQHLLQWLRDHSADYEQVMHRAYQLLLRRDAYAEEIDYWKKQDTLSYALLVGCVEDWARRNQPGLMVTAGTPSISVNSEFLTTVRLSPAIAAEARAAAGLAASGDAGNNLVATGAGHIATGGRIHFVAAGGANLVASRAGGG